MFFVYYILMKLIPGCGDRYFAFQNGYVWSVRHSKIMSPQVDKCGYLVLRIKSRFGYRTFFVHRLIALTFIGKSKKQINHKNGVKVDNCVENLEYVTEAQNQRHAILTGLNKIGSSNPNSKLTEAIVWDIKYLSVESAPALARKYGVGKKIIANIRRGRTWRHVVKHKNSKNY